MTSITKKIISGMLCLFFSSLVFAPNNERIIIEKNEPINPFKKLLYAVGMVETSNNTQVYNPVEEAVGFLQIRPIRLQDYNQRTGSNYSLNDMFNYDISAKVFLFYASQIGPYNFEQIARKWNGSGMRTYFYWLEVKEHL